MLLLLLLLLTVPLLLLRVLIIIPATGSMLAGAGFFTVRIDASVYLWLLHSRSNLIDAFFYKVSHSCPVVHWWRRLWIVKLLRLMCYLLLNAYCFFNAMLSSVLLFFIMWWNSNERCLIVIESRISSFTRPAIRNHKCQWVRFCLRVDHWTKRCRYWDEY